MKATHFFNFASMFVFPVICLLYGYAPLPENKLIVQDFYVVSSEKDATLDDQHARFELHIGFEAGNANYKATALPEIELSCNGVIRRFQLDSTMTYTIDVQPGTYRFQLYAGSNYREIFSREIVISPGHLTIARATFGAFPVIRPVRPIENVVYKPVIYTYADKAMAIKLDLRPKGKFTFTYPEYRENWSGIAHPDGSFTTNGKTYPYLFWEGTVSGPEQVMDHTNGAVVERRNVVAFLEQQLTAIGLNEREKTDFITFWGPRMAASERGFAHFIVNEDYASTVAGLTVYPQPDHVYRLYLLWEPLDSETVLTPKPQVLPVLERGGLTIVEWGGSELHSGREL